MKTESYMVEKMQRFNSLKMQDLLTSKSLINLKNTHPRIGFSFKLISYSILFFFSFYTFSLNAQTQQTDTAIYTLLTEIPIAATYSTTDKLQQLYISTKDNTIIKYSPEGLPLFRYNNNTLGDVHFIDATDPFNILVYYPDFKTFYPR